MAGVSVRELYVENARKNNPHLTPENDFQLMMFSMMSLRNVPDVPAVPAFLDKMWAQRVMMAGSVAKAEAAIAKALGAVVEVSGVKPKSGDAPDVDYVTIPDEPQGLMLRLWPGALSQQEYCMDFVVSATKAPVSVPDGYRLLWHLDLTLPPREVHSVERVANVASTHPGEEQYVLQDGILCELTYNEKVVVRFRAPTRAGHGVAPLDVHYTASCSQ